MGDPDIALIERCRHGDAKAKRELLTRVVPTIRAATRTVLGPGKDADDASAQAAVEVLRELAKYPGEVPLQAWARTIAAQEGLRVGQARQRELGDDKVPSEVSSAPLTPLELDIIEQALDADVHVHAPELEGEERPDDPGEKAPVRPVWVVVFLVATAAALAWLAWSTT